MTMRHETDKTHEKVKKLTNMDIMLICVQLNTTKTSNVCGYIRKNTSSPEK